MIAQDTMKAAVLFGPGDLRVVEVRRPVPGERQVLVRVKAAGVCGSDVRRVAVTGAYSHPRILGHEFSGVVADVGPGVERAAVGDRVAVIPLVQCGRCGACAEGDYSGCEDYDYLGSRSDGGFAEYVVAPEHNLVPLGPTLDFVSGAMVEPAAVALHAVRRGSGADPGTVALVVGAGSVGLLVAQWLRALGCLRVVIADVDDHKLGLARGLGFDQAFNPRAPGCDLPTLVRRLCPEAGGAGLVVDAAGAKASLSTAIACCGRNGRVVILGRPETDLVLGRDTVERVLRKQIDLRGTWAWSPLPMREWSDVVRCMQTGLVKVRPLVTHELPLDAAPRAFEMICRREQPMCKVILRPDRSPD